MSTSQIAIVSVASVVTVLIGACWSLAYFRGWRITAPAWNGKSTPKGTQNAAAGAADDAEGKSAIPAALAAVPGERKRRRNG